MNTVLGKRSEALLKGLREDIASGRYEMGQRLPGELVLCEEYGVSRNTVRRALARLGEEGLVRSRQGVGTAVCSKPGRPAATNTIAMMYNFSGPDLTHIQDYVLGKGYLMCVFSQRREHWNLLAERDFLELVLRQHHAGLLAFCSPLEPRNEDRLMRLNSAGVRVVHVEHYRNELPDQGYVLPDYRLAGAMAARHFKEHGHEHILFVNHNTKAPFSQMLKAGVEVEAPDHDVFELPTDFSNDGPAQLRLMNNLHRRLRTGVICESAGIARLIRGVVESRGKNVLGDVGVIGPELIGPRRDDTQVDSLVFDRFSMLTSAIDAVAGRGALPKRLVPPVLKLLGPAGDGC